MAQEITISKLHQLEAPTILRNRFNSISTFQFPSIFSNVPYVVELYEQLIQDYEKKLQGKCKNIFIQELRDPRLKLLQPLSILVEFEDDYCIASSADLEIYGTGEDEWGAIDDLKRSIAELYFDLKESKLSKHLEGIWLYMKSIIVEG